MSPGTYKQKASLKLDLLEENHMNERVECWQKISLAFTCIHHWCSALITVRYCIFANTSLVWWLVGLTRTVSSARSNFQLMRFENDSFAVTCCCGCWQEKTHHVLQNILLREIALMAFSFHFILFRNSREQLKKNPLTQWANFLGIRVVIIFVFFRPLTCLCVLFDRIKGVWVF